MGFGGGSSGSSSIAGASDAALDNPATSEVLTYNDTVSKWENAVVPASLLVPVRWSGSSWGTYTTNPNIVRLFLSQDDTDATSPTFYSPHDLWFRHPEAT